MSHEQSLLAVKQFRAGALLSYCVFSRATKESLLVDPSPELAQDYAAFISSAGLKPAAIFRTRFQGQPAAPISFGDFKPFATPGVYPDATCLIGEGLVFTGDTLWVGASSRVESRPGVPTDMQALWKSLNGLKAQLAPSSVVFPGRETDGRSFSIWEIELEKNPDLRARDAVELGASKEAEPEMERSSYAQISAEKLSHKTAGKKELLVDVREPDEFQRGHIPGSVNIPLSDLPFHLIAMRAAPRLYVSCQAGIRSHYASATLSYLGLKDVVMLKGGFQAWQNAGLPTEN